MVRQCHDKGAPLDIIASFDVDSEREPLVKYQKISRVKSNSVTPLALRSPNIEVTYFMQPPGPRCTRRTARRRPPCRPNGADLELAAQRPCSPPPSALWVGPPKLTLSRRVTTPRPADETNSVVRALALYRTRLAQRDGGSLAVPRFRAHLAKTLPIDAGLGGAASNAAAALVGANPSPNPSPDPDPNPSPNPN